MKTSTRQEALISGASTYYTGKPCKSGHISPRYTTSRQCSECSKHKGRKYYERVGRKAARSRHLSNKYGLTEDQFTEMLKGQNGLCGICTVPLVLGTTNSPKQCCVDHDHLTGEVRGLLCNHCNRALGLFKDRKESLLKAIEYLEK